MNVILLDKVEKLGDIGEDGFYGVLVHVQVRVRVYQHRLWPQPPLQS